MYGMITSVSSKWIEPRCRRVGRDDGLGVHRAGLDRQEPLLLGLGLDHQIGLLTHWVIAMSIIYKEEWLFRCNARALPGRGSNAPVVDELQVVVQMFDGVPEQLRQR